MTKDEIKAIVASFRLSDEEKEAARLAKFWKYWIDQLHKRDDPELWEDQKDKSEGDRWW